MISTLKESLIIMFRSLAIRAGLLCLALAPLATIASAQLKVAVVNIQKAMADSDELKKASAAVEAKYKPRQDEMHEAADRSAVDRAAAQQRQAEPAGGGRSAGAGPAQTARRAAPVRRPAGGFDRDRQDILGKTSQKMQEVITKLAEEKGLDMVVDASQTLYFKPALDLTADALAAYNKAYPAK